MFIKTDVEPVMNWLVEIVGQDDCLDSKVLLTPDQSHPGLISPLPGTSQVFFKTIPGTDINENIGAWLINELINSDKVYLLGLGDHYPTGMNISTPCKSKGVGVEVNLDRNIEIRFSYRLLKNNMKRLKKEMKKNPNLKFYPELCKYNFELPPTGIDSVVWFNRNIIENFQANKIIYGNMENNLGPLESLKFVVFHELLEAWYKVEQGEPYQEKGNPTKGAHPHAIETEMTWRQQLWKAEHGPNVIFPEEEKMKSGGKVSKKV